MCRLTTPVPSASFKPPSKAPASSLSSCLLFSQIIRFFWQSTTTTTTKFEQQQQQDAPQMPPQSARWILLTMTIVPLLLPTCMYLNRGYTVWFHLITLTYLCTGGRMEFLRRFLILQGTGICLGWYAASMNDWCTHGRFFHILYLNMPTIMKNIMYDHEQDQLVYHTTSSLLTMVASHVLDTILHPGLVYLLWKAHCTAVFKKKKTHISGGVGVGVGVNAITAATTASWTEPLREIVRWPVILSTYAVSRLWSMTHTYYNTGTLGFWYYGYDVYHIHDLDSWFPAYLVEGLLYIMIVGYKLGFEQRTTT